MWLWADKTKACRTGRQAGDPEKESILWLECKRIWRQNFLFFQEPQSFLCLQRIGWSPPTLQRVLDFVQSSANLMVSTSNKYLPQQQLDWCLAKHLGSMVQPSRFIRLTLEAPQSQPWISPDSVSTARLLCAAQWVLRTCTCEWVKL